MTGKYTLQPPDFKTPAPCDDLMEWGQFMENSNLRQVGTDTVGTVRISTVFLGLDHNFGGGPPILWETMVFGGKYDQNMRRYATYDAAKLGHAAMVALVKGEGSE